MAELADALDSGSNGRKAVQVQVLLPAPANPHVCEVTETTTHCWVVVLCIRYLACFQFCPVSGLFKTIFNFVWLRCTNVKSNFKLYRHILRKDFYHINI